MTHESQVDCGGGEEAGEPGSAEEEAQGGDEAAYKGQGDAGEESDEGPRVEAAGVLVDALPAVEVVEEEGAAAEEEVVRDHDARDGAEQAGVADEPAGEVGRGGKQAPGHDADAEDAGDEASGAEADVVGGEVGEVV